MRPCSLLLWLGLLLATMTPPVLAGVTHWVIADGSEVVFTSRAPLEGVAWGPLMLASTGAAVSSIGPRAVATTLEAASGCSAPATCK